MMEKAGSAVTHCYPKMALSAGYFDVKNPGKFPNVLLACLPVQAMMRP